MKIEEIKEYIEMVRAELINHCKQNHITPSKIAHIIGLHHHTLLRFAQGKSMRFGNIQKLESYLDKNTRCKSCMCGHCEARKLFGSESDGQLFDHYKHIEKSLQNSSLSAEEQFNIMKSILHG